MLILTIDRREILKDVQVMLDTEAEMFVIKLWRLLLFEIQAKKNGVSTK